MGRTKRNRNKNKTSHGYASPEIFQLQKWMNLGKSKLKISSFDDTGRGVKTLKQIGIGEELIAVPLHLLITSSLDHPAFGRIGEVDPDLTAELTLTLFLMYEQHLDDQSAYYSYLKVLPNTFSNLYFCTDNEIKLLPEFLKQHLQTQISDMKAQYELLLRILGDGLCEHCNHDFSEVFTYKIFVWAWFIVNTRAVFYPDNSVDRAVALVPFLDMFNHSNEANVQVTVDEVQKVYIIKTLVGFKKYDQVFIRYGAHSNLKLLLEYGFILKNNPHDLVEFSFQQVCSSVNEQLYGYGDISKLKYSFIKHHNLNKNLTLCGDEFSWNLNGLLYIMITTDQDLSILESKTYSNDFSDSEWTIIDQIKGILVKKQLNVLMFDLQKMESIKNCSESFSIAKDLMKKYIEMLQT